MRQRGNTWKMWGWGTFLSSCGQTRPGQPHCRSPSNTIHSLAHSLAPLEAVAAIFVVPLGLCFCVCVCVCSHLPLPTPTPPSAATCVGFAGCAAESKVLTTNPATKSCTTANCTARECCVARKKDSPLSSAPPTHPLRPAHWWVLSDFQLYKEASRRQHTSKQAKMHRTSGYFPPMFRPRGNCMHLFCPTTYIWTHCVGGFIWVRAHPAVIKVHKTQNTPRLIPGLPAHSAHFHSLKHRFWLFFRETTSAL